MKSLEYYIPVSTDVVLVSQAEQVGASASILKAVEIRRNEIRKTVEEHPKHNPLELEEDVDFLLGVICGLNWVLGLPERSREYRNKIK